MPARACAVPPLRVRTNSIRPDATSAAKTIRLPSGESAGGPATSNANCAFSGGRIDDTTMAGGSLRASITRQVINAVAMTRPGAMTHQSRPLAARRSLPGRIAPIHFSSAATSWALCQRSFGSFSRQRSMMCSSAGGDRGWICDSGAGRPETIAAIRLVRVLPSNARLPVAISYSTAPNAKMSVRASASSPSNCSGAMYWNVPRIVPSCVRGF